MFTWSFERGLKPGSPALEVRREVYLNELGYAVLDDEIDQRAYHLLLKVDGVSMAAARASRMPGVEGAFIISRVAVLQEYRHRGFGKMLILELEQRLAALGATEVYISTDTTAMAFCRLLGYRKFGKESRQDEYRASVLMRKKLK